MNIDVCRKCKQMRITKFYLYSLTQEDKYLMCDGVGCFRLYKKLEDVFDNYEFEPSCFYPIIFSEKEIDFFKDFKINEACPYYVEHQLYDWNKKNEF